MNLYGKKVSAGIDTLYKFKNNNKWTENNNNMVLNGRNLRIKLIGPSLEAKTSYFAINDRIESDGRLTLWTDLHCNDVFYS